MNESAAKEAIEKVLNLARADDVFVRMGGSAFHSTRVADNLITQNVARCNVSVRVDCAFGRQHGSAITNVFDDAALQAVVRRAAAIARVSPPDPEYMPPVPSEEAARYPEVARSYDEQTACCAPRWRAEQIVEATKPVEAKGFRLSGAYATGSGFTALGNSAGLRAYHRSTHAEMHCSVLGANGSGWARQASNDVAALDASAIAGQALTIAEAAQCPADLEPGRYTVVLRPAAVFGLLGYLWSAFDAKATDEGRTFLRGKLGTRVCGRNISIGSDPSDKRSPGRPFQSDGLASQKLAWIREGVLENLIYSRYWAARKKRAATGRPANTLVAGGDSTVESLIRGVDRGILVTRFWYIRAVDPMRASITGMTRDGLFLIERGQVAGPIRHMRFNERLFDLLGRVEQLGVPERVSLSAMVPAMRVREFNFTSATRF